MQCGNRYKHGVIVVAQRERESLLILPAAYVFMCGVEGGLTYNWSIFDIKKTRYYYPQSICLQEATTIALAHVFSRFKYIFIYQYMVYKYALYCDG